MESRRYNPIWRILAGLVALATIATVALLLVERDHALPLSAAWGAILVVLVLPRVALTGRAPLWFERVFGRDV